MEYPAATGPSPGEGKREGNDIFCLNFPLVTATKCSLHWAGLGGVDDTVMSHEHPQGVIHVGLGLRPGWYSDPVLFHVRRREVHLEETEVDFSTLLFVRIIVHETVSALYIRQWRRRILNNIIIKIFVGELSTLMQ